MSGYRFTPDSNGNWVYVDSGEAYGEWKPWGFCQTPRVFFTGIAPKVGVAASARTYLTSSAPTRPLSIIFNPPPP